MQALVQGIYASGDKRARMPVDKSANSQGTNTAAREISLEQLYAHYRRPIHSYAYRLLGSQEDADDVTQEVFVRACTAWEGLYEHDHLSAWLYRIATNLSVDLLRRRKRIAWWPLGGSSSSSSGEEERGTDFMAFLSDTGGIPEVAERDVIRQTLERIPADYAVVLVLHAAQGVPYQKIAEIVGISPNAAATRISRAKKMFIEQYQHLSKGGVGKRGKRT
jgi:RNA polymerase sigma-70 factor (ECF subfamily)